MYIIKSCLISLILIFQCSTLNACGIAVHNEVTYRSLENFIPKTDIQQTYKNDILESASYSQAGSFFPDWGYQCLGYNQQSEDAHWPTFIKTAVNYIRQVYPVSEFHTDKHVKGLITFVFAIMSHGMADVKWHSLSGLSDYFIVAMANSDFHGNTKDSHLAADAGAEFTLRHSSKLSYLNETWHVPVKDIVEIYKILYASSEEHKKKRVPLESHIQYCMTAAFAASKIDVEFGQLMFGYYGSKSPFLTEELYDYYRGGIEDMSASVSDCYPELIAAFEHGSTHTFPDTLCAKYFYTALKNQPKCLQRHHGIKSQHRSSSSIIYKDYNAITGVLTITVDKQQQQQKQQDRHHDYLPPVVVIVPPTQQTSSHEVEKNVRFRFQSPQSQLDLANLNHENAGLRSNNKTTISNNKCLSLHDDHTTLTIPMSSARVGHQIASGDFNGNGQLDMAISAPYDFNRVSQEQTGTVFILNNSTTTTSSGTHDIRDESDMILQGNLAHGRFGWSMTTIDINQDGIDDLAISTAPFGQQEGSIEIYLGQAKVGLADKPSIRIQLQSQALLGTVLAGIDVDQDGFQDLVIGCPLCSAGNQPQVGIVYMFKSHSSVCTTKEPEVITQPDISIENPNLKSKAGYDHFGESILLVKDTILIGAPGYSSGSKQRVGRVYAFDAITKTLKWIISGTNEFQQFGRVLATDNHEIVAISSPSEETVIGLQKFWQGGTVRIYNWNKMQIVNDIHAVNIIPNFVMEHGMISVIKGRTNAGHLGQSLSIFGNNQQEAGIWIGEPMSEKENGRVYRWLFKSNSQDIECIRNNQVILARFGSQIGPLGTDAICITSQRYGQNARYSGAVTFFNKKK